MESIDEKWRIPGELWFHIEKILPPGKSKPKGGRPRMINRKAMEAIFFILRTGCQWKELPRSLGASSTVYDRFREWEKAGVFEKLWQEGLIEYDKTIGIDWEWQSVDGCMTKAPLGGEKTGANPTDRAKSGTKRSILTDGNGIPLALKVDGANRHDKKLFKDTVTSIVIERPSPTEQNPQNMALDKGYDFPDIRDLVTSLNYIGHIKSRGEEINDKALIPNYRARRWVVERTHSWMNRFRRILIRWEKKAICYLAFLYFACAWIVFRAAGVFG